LPKGEKETMTVQFIPGPDYVRAIAPYVAGKPIAEVARDFGLDEAKIVKLASNENPLGMPAGARRALLDAVAALSRYPDASGHALKLAIGARYGVAPDWVTLGNGSNDILDLAARSFLQAGQSAMHAQYAFAVYGLATQAVGARAIVVPAIGYGHDLAGMLAAIEDDTRLLFIANPNNPTGSFVPGAELAAFLDLVPPHVVVVLDEAYTEFLPAQKGYDSIGWTALYPNLLVVRTFSKAYGLAGLRVGFGIAQPALGALLDRVRQPFNVNSLAQAAAIAALEDLDFLARSAELNSAGYRQLTQAFTAMGLEFLPSSGNFILVRVGRAADAGARVFQALLAQGVIVRPVANYGLPEWLRVSIGLPEENAILIEALRAVPGIAS
jgi:histidinol-phosphate aminotransferase